MSSLDRALDEPALVFTVWRWELDIYLKTFSFLHANDVRQTHCDESAIHHGVTRISWICVTDSGPGTHAAPCTRPASPPRPRHAGRRDQHVTDMAVWQRHQTDWFRSRPSVVWSTHIPRTSHHGTLGSRGSTYLSSTFCILYRK